MTTLEKYQDGSYDLTTSELIELMSDYGFSQEQRRDIARRLENSIKCDLSEKMKKTESGKTDAKRLEEAIKSRDEKKVRRYLKSCADSGTLTEELQSQVAELGIYLRCKAETVAGIEVKKAFSATDERPEKTIHTLLLNAYKNNRGCQFSWQGIPMTLHKPSADGKKGWRFSIKAANGRRQYGVPAGDVQTIIPRLLLESLES